MRDAISTRGEGRELTWIRSRAVKRQFELHEGDTTLATLTWSRGTHARGQWGEMHYDFSRQGWLRPRVLVRAEGSGEAGAPIATSTQCGGLLSFPDGRTFLWKKPKWFTGERIWIDSAAAELVRFHPARRTTVVVTTQADSTGQPEIPLLILLGQYLIVLAAQDAETASAAAVASVVATS